ncbi:hypothetical protein L6164_001636 [Bauhinia variegata]|uniref:Uncharacterized protein n=1 Tax=Bauhinia variegata TaxID=167791 RepID=A0ACB9QAA4_BAUVA|nr:hypothetical protein L6164_001636 [Bauhinia variegata]
MVCSISSCCSLTQPLRSRHKLSNYPNIRSQAFSSDNEKPANIVDANLSVLRERIQQVRKKEKLRNTCGWNYQHCYDQKHRRDAVLSESIGIMGSACGAVGLVFFTGSLFICLVSLLIHL